MKLLMVLAMTFVVFVASGGWHYIVPGDAFVYGLFYRIDTAEAERQAWINWFLYCGPAGAVVGLVCSICVLIWKRRRES
jgi:hypothetical protein